MDEVQELLRYVFQTDNEFTIPISGAGSAAMEACLANLIEPGDVVLVGVSGYFSERIYEMALRYRADVRRVEAVWGNSLTLDQLRDAMDKHKPSLLCLVHGETSTGVRQDMDGVSDLCRKHGALLMVDTVASLGGVPFFVDGYGVDACYTGGQKCLSGPPGISPLTFSAKAVGKIHNRKTPVANWYLDATMLAQYWCPLSNTPRKYHHTTPTNLVYGLREALVQIAEEGLENVWSRHKASAEALYHSLSELSISCMIPPERRLYSLTSVLVPDGVDAKAVQQYLLNVYGTEVAGGLGHLAGKIWRVGLMGFNSRVANVKFLLVALKEALQNAKSS